MALERKKSIISAFRENNVHVQKKVKDVGAELVTSGEGKVVDVFPGIL